MNVRMAPVVMHVDITERKRGEDKIVHLNRVYAMLSGIHTLIVRVQDRDELFREACRIAVEHGKFGIAWIGLLDPATLEVTPVACDGLDPTEHLGDFRSSAHADHPFGKGEVGRALRERKAAFSNNLSRTPSPAGERRKVALRSGYLSRIALPLLVENNPVGVIVLFARERDFFNEEELKLLSELAGDISFALENISRQQKLDKAAQELRESERRFSDLLGNVELVSLMLDCERAHHLLQRLPAAADGLAARGSDWPGLVRAFHTARS